MGIDERALASNSTADIEFEPITNGFKLSFAAFVNESRGMVSNVSFAEIVFSDPNPTVSSQVEQQGLLSLDL